MPRRDDGQHDAPALRDRRGRRRQDLPVRRVEPPRVHLRPERHLLATFGQTQTGGDNRGVEVNEAQNAVYVVDAEHSDVDVFGPERSLPVLVRQRGQRARPVHGRRSPTGDRRRRERVGRRLRRLRGREVHARTARRCCALPSPAEKPPAGLLGQPRDVAIDPTTGRCGSPTRGTSASSGSRRPGLDGRLGAARPGRAVRHELPAQHRDQPGEPADLGRERARAPLQVYNYPTGATAPRPTSPRSARSAATTRTPGTSGGRWTSSSTSRRPAQMRVVIGDRMAASVKIFNAITRQEILMIPVANHGTAVDPATGNIYINNPSADRIEVFDQNGVAVANPTTGIAPFRFGSQRYAVRPDAGRGRRRDQPGRLLPVRRVALARTGVGPPRQLPRAAGAATTRDGAYNYRGAIGLAADTAGRLYVTDAGQRPHPGLRPEPAKLQDPTNPAHPAITAPANQRRANAGPVTITGTATDNLSVGKRGPDHPGHDDRAVVGPGNSSWEVTLATADPGRLLGRDRRRRR